MDNVGSLGRTDYSSYISQAQAGSVQSSISNVNKKDATDEEMMAACKEFEQYMVEQVYKQMEKTVMKSDEDKNEYEEYFDDFRIQAYAKMVSEQGKLGLADQLYESMKRNSGGDGVVE